MRKQQPMQAQPGGKLGSVEELAVPYELAELSGSPLCRAHVLLMGEPEHCAPSPQQPRRERQVTRRHCQRPGCRQLQPTQQPPEHIANYSLRCRVKFSAVMVEQERQQRAGQPPRAAAGALPAPRGVASPSVRQKGHTALARSMSAAGSMAICWLWHSRPSTCTMGGRQSGQGLQASRYCLEHRMQAGEEHGAVNLAGQRRQQQRRLALHEKQTDRQAGRDGGSMHAYVHACSTHHGQHVVHQLVPSATHCSSTAQRGQGRRQR